MIKLFSLIENAHNIEIDSNIQAYSVGDRTVEIVNTSSHLQEAVENIKDASLVAFDSEQRPTFRKGESSHGISIIQLATKTKCYIIQTKQIKNLKPLISILENENIIKVGSGLRGDKEALFRQFRLKLRATIDLENVFKALSSKNQLGAKKAALIILDRNLQKSKKISKSNWEIKDLSSSQIKYAAEDATVIFDVLERLLKDYPFTLEIMPEFFKAKYE
ncbi:3'-5' exonuclease [Arcobacter sp. YIC-464]|uniref:3'-5' exonuclease n=1 Tax=Arcobacter sp. YIC-464 TaxID=3376631 RepID=UPI003C18DEF3